jgi:hypothetical protein
MSPAATWITSFPAFSTTFTIKASFAFFAAQTMSSWIGLPSKTPVLARLWAINSEQ